MDTGEYDDEFAQELQLVNLRSQRESYDTITEFIPYEQAVALKELGFSGVARYGQEASVYSKEGKHVFYCNYGMMGSGLSEGYIPAPSYRQVFTWFRKKHNLYHSIIPYRSTHDNYVDGTFHIEVRDSSGVNHTEHDDNEYFYEEAEVACINKLIELVKERGL